jgi:hypothetical protein
VRSIDPELKRVMLWKLSSFDLGARLVPVSGRPRGRPARVVDRLVGTPDWGGMAIGRHEDEAARC